MLTQQSLILIDAEIKKYPLENKKSAVMSALRIAQQEKGWLSAELIEYVAQYLEMTPAQVMEVASFYSMYNLQPVGKFKLTVCTNLPCALRGAVDTLEYLEKKLNIKVGETTADGMFTLQISECMGACGDAPVLIVNNHKMCGFMSIEAIDQKLSELISSTNIG
jgi:NADH-quinone oxidoreductase subunit E